MKEAAENLRGKSHFSAPPLVFRPSLPQSVRSSGVDFGDAEKEERSRQVSGPKGFAYAKVNEDLAR